jgi:transposase InsO family protein
MAGDPPEGCGCTSTISRVLIAGHDRFPTYYGPEFVSRALDQWAYLHQVTLDFSRPEKPTDNAPVESFNGRLRDECLNTNWFLSPDDAKRKSNALSS